MTVTQDTIAEHLGISRISVARSLNGYGKVSEETRERVHQAARELGYTAHSNGAARTMAARRHGKRALNGVIAMCFDFEDGQLPHDPFFLPFFEGAQQEAQRRGLDIFLWQSNGQTLPRPVLEGGVDGVLCFRLSDELKAHAASIGLPVVTLSMLHKGVQGLAPDDQEGSRLATQYLIELGHMRIAYLGHKPDFSVSVRRLSGYESAIRENGFKMDKRLVEATLPGPNCGSQGVSNLLERGADFTGLVCYNDLIAMGAIREMELRGLQVPGDVSVVGFDDISVQQHFVPAITSISFDRSAMGRRAVEILCEESEAPQHKAFAVQLVERASTRAV